MYTYHTSLENDIVDLKDQVLHSHTYTAKSLENDIIDFQDQILPSPSSQSQKNVTPILSSSLHLNLYSSPLLHPSNFMLGP
jgi:hypothetical protein